MIFPHFRSESWHGRLRTSLLSVTQNVRDFLFPSACPFCKAFVEGHAHGFCAACESKFHRPPDDFCPWCGSFRHGQWYDAVRCSYAERHRLQFDRVIALAPHEGLLRQAVLRLKYLADLPLLSALVDKLFEYRGTLLRKERADVVVPVPDHWRRALSRGHSSAKLLASQLAKRLDLPLLDPVIRHRATAGQKGLRERQRWANVRGAFRSRRSWFPSSRVTSTANILLVDDVVTTGATCSEVARVLKKAGAARVVVVCLARAEG